MILTGNYGGFPVAFRAVRSFHEAVEPVGAAMQDDRLPSGEWDSRRLRFATLAAGVALWSWKTETDEISLDERARRLWSLADEENVTFARMSMRIHPQDLDRVQSAFAATRAVPGPYEIDFRILHDGAVRWISARGKGNDEGLQEGRLFGVFLDVTERKLAEEARERLANEMSHRVRNLFAIAAALTRIAARTAESPLAMAEDLSQRLLALLQAHQLIQPSLAMQRKAAKLGDLLAVLLGAYDDGGAIGGRIRVMVPEIQVGENSTTTLALIIHELMTNCLKHGALAHQDGTLRITGTLDERDVTLSWREAGGPSVTPPRHSGFGTELVARSVADQLGGSIEYAWPESGAVVTLRCNRARLGA